MNKFSNKLFSLNFKIQNYTSFGHNCNIPKPDMLHPKSRSVYNLNGCGFGMKHLKTFVGFTQLMGLIFGAIKAMADKKKLIEVINVWS
jgi:hypothetical protein